MHRFSGWSVGPRGCLAAPFELMDATASVSERTDLPIV